MVHEILGAAAEGVGIANDIGLGDLLNLATATGFAGLSWYLIVRQIPKMINDFRIDIRDERQSREAMNDRFANLITTITDKFMKMETDSRERFHEQRMEDRKVYLEATQTLIRESLAALKEVKNGHA